MNIRIITDSSSDIPQSTARALGITVIPLHIRFDQEEFLDGVTLSTTEFYQRLTGGSTMPKTSQIPPYDYQKVFEEATADGGKALYIGISSKVSGSLHNASMAAEAFEGSVAVIDSLHFCTSLYIMVLYAARLRDAGEDFDSIVSKVKESMSRIRLISLFDTLEYLKKGGRLSAAASMVGGLLHIKPVVTIEQGEVKVLKKARGSKNGSKILMDFIREQGGIDFDMPYATAYSGLTDEHLQAFIEESRDLYTGPDPDIRPDIVHVGPTVGTYAGPGAFSTAFFVR